MSVWSAITGHISFQRNNSINLKRFAEKYFDEYTITTKEVISETCKCIYMEIHFCMDGAEASKTSTDFLYDLKEVVPSVKIDVNVEIRWVA